MRFSTIVPVLAAATFVAAQEQIIIGTLNDIADATTTLGDRVTGFTSTLASECALQSAALSLLDVLSQGTTTVSGSRVLTAIESVDLLDPFNALQAQVDTTVNNTIDTKSAFVSANVASVVLAKLNDIKDSASTYADAVVSKVPNESGLPDIARSLAQGILDSIQRGIDAFADQTDGPTSVDCNASTSSSSSAAASASATSTGSASATPPPVSTTLSGTAPIGTGSGLPGHTCTTVTSVVSTLTTFCPGPTTVTYGTNTYTVTEATTLTVTDCKLFPQELKLV